MNGTTLLYNSLVPAFIETLTYSDVNDLTKLYVWPFQLRAKMILAGHPKRLMREPITDLEVSIVNQLLDQFTDQSPRTSADIVLLIYSRRLHLLFNMIDSCHSRWRLGDIEWFLTAPPAVQFFFKLAPTESAEETYNRRKAEVDKVEAEGSAILNTIESLKKAYGVD